MRYRAEDIGLKFATALLLHRGELSVEDIRAIPFFRSSDDSEAVIKALQANFVVDTYTRKVAAHPIPQWEEIIKLRTQNNSKSTF